MESVVARLKQEAESVTGIILTSGKSTFFAGGDLHELSSFGSDDADRVSKMADAVKLELRQLETLGKPVVAAINGSALGGGLEIALACHYRIVLDAPGVVVGFPEVTLGLLPGGGGIVRTVRMLGIERALDSVLLSGARYSPSDALELGLVDEIVNSNESLLSRARQWVRTHSDATQPWDQPMFEIPGGDPSSPQMELVLPSLAARLRKSKNGAPMAAERGILCAAVEGAQVDFDDASVIETRYFTELVCSAVSKNKIQSFFDLQAVKAGVSRPDGNDRHFAKVVAILGAGVMGAGIAYACASAGLEVRLKDVDLVAAKRGKEYVAAQLDKLVAKGDQSRESADGLLTRIRTISSAAELAGADLIVEAVFEDPNLKQAVFAEVAEFVAPDAVLATNTSSLPIGELAMGLSRPSNFIGLHFFSPVERMDLVEIIVGEQTSEATLAKAVDIVLQIRKIPIVVSDSRGFFTSRIILNRLMEAAAMVGEGIRAPSIEQASLQAGYPVGTLALLDELTLTLPRKIRGQFRQAAEVQGQPWIEHPGDAVLDVMVTVLERSGRPAGQGFYEYENGRRLGLWPSLVQHFGSAESAGISLEDLKDRLLFAEVVEAIRCLDEGVVHSAADANVGSLYGIGFPSWTGGAIQFVNGYPGGTPAFVARSSELSKRYGERFAPPNSLLTATGSGADWS
jgi:3-hydroxyacyl-CoA dehydrogenase/enoyl-CoA hydratase/3-hydroxybutyryl-CoA epimerase